MKPYDSSEEFQKWKKEVNLEFTQKVSDRALEFQHDAAEAGSTVSVTEAVHQAIKKMSSPEDEHYWLKRCQDLNFDEIK